MHPPSCKAQKGERTPEYYAYAGWVDKTNGCQWKPKNQCSVISCQFCLVFNSIWFRFVSFSLVLVWFPTLRAPCPARPGQQTNDRFMVGNQTQDHKYLNLWGLYTNVCMQAVRYGCHMYINIYIFWIPAIVIIALISSWSSSLSVGKSSNFSNRRGE